MCKKGNFLSIFSKLAKRIKNVWILRLKWSSIKNMQKGWKLTLPTMEMIIAPKHIIIDLKFLGYSLISKTKILAIISVASLPSDTFLLSLLRKVGISKVGIQPSYHKMIFLVKILNLRKWDVTRKYSENHENVSQFRVDSKWQLNDVMQSKIRNKMRKHIKALANIVLPKN